MIEAIIFSKNRAPQLDLLLRSIATRAPQLFEPIQVIFTATDKKFQDGYELCIDQHPDVRFTQQGSGSFSYDLQNLVMPLVEYGETDNVTFFCDDDIFIRPFTDQPSPETILRLDNNVLCVSLRMGVNCSECYPLQRAQSPPAIQYAVNDAIYWEWVGADGDWGYPGSLDGHIFRRKTLLPLLNGQNFGNPNQLEEVLVRRCYSLEMTTVMACYRQSVITGVPINRVNDTHPNRAGEKFFMDPEALNHNYLNGQRLNLGNISKKQITAAHNELKLSFAR